MSQISVLKTLLPAFLCSAASALILHLSWGGGQKRLRCRETAPDRHKCFHLSWMERERERERERENSPAVEEIMLTYISLANIFPQYLSAASACCNLNSPNTTGARVTDNYSHCGRHIPGNILQGCAESDRSQTSGVPASPARDNTYERVIKNT